MATSQQPTPQGQQYVVDFSQSINLDQVNEKVYPFDDGVAPHITNTGILRDDGVTNLYETSDDAAASDDIMYAPNGDRILVSAGVVYVNGVRIGDLGFGRLTDRIQIPFDAYDMAISTTGTAIILTKKGRLVEYDFNTGTVLNSSTAAFVNLEILDACLFKTQAMTFATAYYTWILATPTTVTCGARIVATNYTVFTGVANSLQFQGLSAYALNGTYIVGGIPDNTSMPRSYYGLSPYAVWTPINECTYLSADVPIVYTTTTGNITLLGTPWNGSAINFANFGTSITLLAGGGAPTITPRTAGGLSIAPAKSYTGFGFASGRYTSATGTVDSPYIMCSSAVPATADKTVTAYGVNPQAIASITPAGNELCCVTINGIPSHIVWPGQPATGQGALVTEIGSVNRVRPLTSWQNNTLSYWIGVVRTLTGFQVFKHENPGGVNIRASMKPIAKNLLQFNDSNGSILNTDTGKLEYNQGGMLYSFYSDIFLTGSNALAIQSDSIYSNNPDIGIIQNVLGTSTSYSVLNHHGTTATYKAPIFFYVGVGTLSQKYKYLNGAFTPGDNVTAYVTNSNLATPYDSVFGQNGITLPSQSALQTLNFSSASGFAQYYAGYTLANQYPVSYQFFNLFGQLYGFDGTKIYRMPVNGAVAGTPEQVAVASGLTFITNAPTVAWFWSSFDNSVYSFDGGQNVQKWQEMTGVATVTSGAYSVLESSLYLQLSDNTTLVFRDEKASQLANAYTSQTIYATDTGTYFVNNANGSQSKKWSYFAGTGTPIALTWQSGFYGWGRNQWGRITQVVFTLKVADSATTDITVNFKGLTSTDNWTETMTFTGGSYTASSTGYVRLQYNPTNPLVYGASVGISCTKKVTLYDCVVYYTDGGVAMVPNLGP